VYKAQLNGNENGTHAGLPVAVSSEALGGIADDPQALHPRNPIRVLWQRLWIIVVVTALVVGLAVGFTYMQTPTYGASIKILVGQKQGSATDNLATEVQGLQGITETVATAISTRPVAQGVVQQLDLPMYPEEIQANVTAEVVGTSQFIDVTYEDTDPERAIQVVNTLGEVFSQQVAEVSSDTNDITATVWEKAVSSYAVGPNLMRNILLALVLGLMLGVGLALLLDYLDDDWKSPEEVEWISGTPTLGVIPKFKVKGRKSKGGY
jgi:capsular polysaccharide biosynthesis protein